MARESFESLPSPLDEIAEVAGLDVALEIARSVGGSRVGIPPRPLADHWLTNLVGRQKADLICAHFRALATDGQEKGWRHIIIPRGPAGLFEQAKARFYAARDEGLSIRAAARKAQVHERSAFRYEAARSGSHRDQLFLFDPPG